MKNETLANALRTLRVEWQREIWDACHQAVMAELFRDVDRRDAMLRQLNDIARERGLVD